MDAPDGGDYRATPEVERERLASPGDAPDAVVGSGDAGRDCILAAERVDVLHCAGPRADHDFRVRVTEPHDAILEQQCSRTA